jgi:hypothetical protein
VQAKPLVEMAATALALAMTHHVVHLGQLDVTRDGDPTDFRSPEIPCMLERPGRMRTTVKRGVSSDLVCSFLG